MDNSTIPVICTAKFDSSVGMFTFESALEVRKEAEMKPVPFVAAGFYFTLGSSIDEVPFDPHLPHLFAGEELLHSSRLWTHGWDFFTPTENIVFHHYDRVGKPKYWENIPEFFENQTRSLVKVRYLLGASTQLPVPELLVDIDKYGMGNARSADEYWKWSQVDFATNSSTSHEKFC